MWAELVLGKILTVSKITKTRSIANIQVGKKDHFIDK